MAESMTSQALAALVARRLAERRGEFAVLGLGRSGQSAARMLRAAGLAVYASDQSASAAAQSAATSLAESGIAVSVGGHDLDRIARAVVLVVSPGIPPEVPACAAARAAGVPIVSEVEVALRLLPGIRVIATTGTNGKTTTTALIGHLLRAMGRDAAEVGNIGTAVSEVALCEPRPDWLALEISSFQLHDTPGLLPDVGVLTTLSPDHLDRYRSVAEYYADKARLFANASATSRWVVTADNADVAAMTAEVPGTIYRFSTARTDVDAYLEPETGWLHVLGAPLVPSSALALPGAHNVANALAALLAVMVADPSHATPENRAKLAEALRTFGALPHRLEPVADRDGVRWLNDSKATNVASTLVAITAMTRPAIVLLGGRHKGEPYHTLVSALLSHAKAVLVYGEAAPLILEDLRGPLSGQIPVEDWHGATFAAVVARARALAVAGDVVLLSPACSSYDMFPNYEVRGRQFAALAAGTAPA